MASGKYKRAVILVLLSSQENVDMRSMLIVSVAVNKTKLNTDPHCHHKFYFLSFASEDETGDPKQDKQ